MEIMYICKKIYMRQLFTILLLQICRMFCSAQVIINPLFDRMSYEVMHPHIDKVELIKDSTKIYCSINYQESWNYSIPMTMFIEDLKDNRRYQITKCIGLPFEQDERVFDYGGTSQFVFCFPQIEGLQRFNLVEDSSKDKIFNIYGIDITSSYPQEFEELEYKRFMNMSDFYKTSGNIDKYLEFEEKELSAAQFVFGMRSLAASTCYNQLAQFYNDLGNHKKAIDLGLQALECDSIQIGVENREYPVYVYTLGSLSRFYQDSGDDASAIACKHRCIRIWKSLENADEYLTELYNLLITGRDNDGISKRLAIVNKELESLPDFIDISSLPIAALYKAIAVNYSLLDDNKNAIEYCNKAISIMNSTGNNKIKDYAELLGQKCKYQQRRGLKDEAISSGEVAKQLYDSLGIESPKYAELLSDLAWAYGLNLNYEKSVLLEQEACRIYEHLKDWISLAEGYNSISHYYQSAESLENSEYYIKKAIEILNSHDNANQYIIDTVELTGNTFIDNPFVLASIKQRIDTDKSGLYQTLARIYSKQGRLSEAIETEKVNGEILRELCDSLLYSIHLLTISEYYMKNKQYSEAINCAENSIQFLSKQERISLAFPKMHLAQIYYETDNFDKAIQRATEAVSLSEQSGDFEIKTTALSLLSQIYWRNNDFYKAENYLSNSLDLQKQIILSNVKGMTSEQRQRLWNKYEHNFLLYRNVIESSNREDKLLSKLYDYVLFSKSLMLYTEADSLDSIMSRLTITWKDIQQHLSDQDIAIEFVSTIEGNEERHAYHALVVDKNGTTPYMIPLYRESDLDIIRKTDNRDIQDIVGELIWRPILKQFGQVKNIYFSPDGIFHVLPIEYHIFNGTDNITDNYNLFRLSSTKEIVSQHYSQRRSNAMLYGGLEYSDFSSFIDLPTSIVSGIAERGGFEPLYNTLTEIKEIKALLAGDNIFTTLYTGGEGTEDSFRKLSGQHIDIIHLATHGMYVNAHDLSSKKAENNFDFLEMLNNENDPVKEDISLTHSFLVMAGGNMLNQRQIKHAGENDGILTAKEISQIDFGGLDLVVLSACESGLGDIDNGGVYGLQRGFKKAGANTILMSLSKVDDEATRILMVEFYRNLMQGKSKHQSLKEAQKYLRIVENGKYDKPEYWAAFIMLDGLN